MATRDVQRGLNLRSNAYTPAAITSTARLKNSSSEFISTSHRHPSLERESRLALDDGLPRARRMRRLVGVDDRVDDGLSAPFLALGALLLEPINSG
jgi:hypothetical protein